MPESTVFARVVPKSIKITEKYNYRAELIGTFHIEELPPEAGKPNGVIEILIPYDGDKYLTNEALNDIKRQNKNFPKTPTARLRIGYLSFANYKGLTLEQNVDLAMQYDVAALDIPLLTGEVQDPTRLTDDYYACQLTYPYQPKSPDIPPLKLKVKISDENALDNLDENLWDLLDGRPLQPSELTLLDNAARSLAKQEGFLRGLRFTFQPILKLPEAIGRENDEQPPKLTKFTLQWPGTVSPNHVMLTLLDKAAARTEAPVLYNPEQGAIEWGDVVLQGRKSTKTNLYFYTTPQMQLMVDQPSALYQQGLIEGTVEIKLPRTFSNLQVEHFSATGQKSGPDPDPEKPLIKPETVFTLKFSLALADCFGRKTISPYQQLQFEGVVLNELRIGDIERVLEEAGFVTRAQRINEQRERKYYLVAGRQKQNLHDCWLWVLVEGTPAPTTREKKIIGDHSYKTTLETGHLTIYLRGKFGGDPSDLLGLMNQVQQKLKAHFQPMYEHS